jgi:uncharacterized membrane protein YphA (DoxX/SURF4 family)
MTAPSIVAKWPMRAPYVLSVLRLVAAFLFMQFGTAKLAVAYLYGHAPHGFWPVLNQGSPAILFCFIWLYLSAAGPGPWSLDAKRGS